MNKYSGNNEGKEYNAIRYDTVCLHYQSLSFVRINDGRMCKLAEVHATLDLFNYFITQQNKSVLKTRCMKLIVLIECSESAIFAWPNKFNLKLTLRANEGASVYKCVYAKCDVYCGVPRIRNCGQISRTKKRQHQFSILPCENTMESFRQTEFVSESHKNKRCNTFCKINMFS